MSNTITPRRAWARAFALYLLRNAELEKATTDKAIDRAGDRAYDAAKAMFLTPAPDATAFALKMGEYFSANCRRWSEEDYGEVQAAIMADVKGIAMIARPSA